MKMQSLYNANNINTDSYAMELNALLHVSHVVGYNPYIVQAGGGNTSVKCSDGKRMLIKASGTPLSGMTCDQGWVMVNMDTIKKLFSNASFDQMPVSEREAKVLSLLYSSIIEPENARPSVETPLHVLLDRVVIHTHPVAANALTCHSDAVRFLKELFRDEKIPPLWVPYIDPGATLAFAVAKEINGYKEKYSCMPRIILQQNHGIFVSAPEPTECLALHAEVLNRIETFFTNSKVSSIDKEYQKSVIESIQDVFNNQWQIPCKIRFSKRQECIEAAEDNNCWIFEGALSPDHVVYNGPRAVIVPESADAEELKKELEDFYAIYKVPPKLVVLRNKTICFIGETENKLNAAEALACAAVNVFHQNGGELHFLAEKDVGFIMNWEAEHYRAKQK